MRFEVLSMVYRSANRCAAFEVDISGFVLRLGVWQEELIRTLEYLDSLRRQSIRDEPTSRHEPTPETPEES